MPLHEATQALILKQQGSLHKMRRLLERLQECIGFARSTGGDGEELVRTYLQRTLQLDARSAEMRDFDAAGGKTQQGAVLSSVKLKHLVSLADALTRRIACGGDLFEKLADVYRQPLSAGLRQGRQKPTKRTPRFPKLQLRPSHGSHVRQSRVFNPRFLMVLSWRVGARSVILLPNLGCAKPSSPPPR